MIRKSVYIRTLGCQMNEKDSEVICGLLQKEGFKITDDFREAQILLFNTCSVRKHAEDRVISLIGEYVKKQKRKPASLFNKPLVGIVGCMAKNYEQRIFSMTPLVDFVVGPSDIDKIPQIVRKLLLDERSHGRHRESAGIFSRKIWETNGSVRPEDIYRSKFYRDKKRCSVIISEGCSNFCSYCIVPYVRGPIRHRKHENIIEEIERALAAGVTSVTLLGQNVNSYHDGEVDFIKLLHKVNSLKKLRSFNFLTSHPKDASQELFKAVSDLKKIDKTIHLPVQSGSSRILKIMNRGYSRENYLELVSKYRKIVKGGKITTDIIVGFPTEQDSDFKETLSLVRSLEFNAAYIFKYSPRPNTESFKMKDDVSLAEKERRHSIILAEQVRISKKKNER